MKMKNLYPLGHIGHPIMPATMSASTRRILQSLMASDSHCRRTAPNYGEVAYCLGYHQAMDYTTGNWVMRRLAC